MKRREGSHCEGIYGTRDESVVNTALTERLWVTPSADPLPLFAKSSSGSHSSTPKSSECVDLLCGAE